MDVTSPVLEDGGEIPERFTCEGEDLSPTLRIQGVPDEAETLAVIVDDPDAPRPEPWVHWLIWNLPAGTDELPEGYPPSGSGSTVAQARQGENDFGDVRYGGPCPPPGHGTHRYRFHVYAMDTELEIPEGSSRAELEKVIQGRILDEAKLVGTFER